MVKRGNATDKRLVNLFKLGIGAGRRSKPLTIEQKDMKISDELVAVN